DAGQTLGKIEAERAAHIAPGDRAMAGAAHAARLNWVRLANAIESMLPFAGLTAAEAEGLMASLRKAEGAADQRAARRNSSDPTADVEAEPAVPTLAPGAAPAATENE